MNTLNHLSRFLTPLSGTDKGLRIIQYTSKVLVWWLRKNKYELRILRDYAKRVATIASKFSEARTIHRLFGLVDTVIGCVTNTEKDRFLKFIYDLQNLSMLVYYPMEHVWWLASVGVIKGIKDPDRISRWSCAAWAVYIVLELIADLYKLIRNLRRARMLDASVEAQRAELKSLKDGPSQPFFTLVLAALAERFGIFWRTVRNLGDGPNAINWSLPSYPIPDVLVGVFGTISSIAGIRMLWKRTA